MNTKWKLMILITGIFVNASNSQDLITSWSDKQIYKENESGIFREYAGDNSKYIYLLYGSIKRMHPYSKFKLTAWDKSSMKKIAEHPIIGFPQNQKTDNKYDGLTYHKTITFEDILYVFWTKSSSTSDELYIQSFDSKLKPVEKLKKIYELRSGKGDIKKTALFVMGNTKYDERIIIGGERGSKKGEAIIMEYKLLNKDFTFSESNQVTLPVKVIGKSSGLTSIYEFGDAGSLYITSIVKMSKEEIKLAKKGESTRFPILTIVDLSTGNATSFPVKFDNKNIFYFSIIESKENLKICGFFCDINKDPKGDETHGIFYSLIDNKTFTIEDVNFSYFTKELIFNLLASDSETKKKSSKSRTKEAENEAIDDQYVIEDIQSIDEKNLVLFCSKMLNYSRTSCDSKGNCTTSYYCKKSDVTAFKINNKGDIIWASHLDRFAKYGGWYVYDVKVINDGNKFYVIYGSDYQILGEKKTNKSKKSASQKSDLLEYAVFDYKTGDYTKREQQINPINTAKKDKKIVLPTNVIVIDDNFFAISQKSHFKPTLILGCLGSIACFPLIYPTLVGNWFKQHEGYYGLIHP